MYLLFSWINTCYDGERAWSIFPNWNTCFHIQWGNRKTRPYFSIIEYFSHFMKFQFPKWGFKKYFLMIQKKNISKQQCLWHQVQDETMQTWQVVILCFYTSGNDIQTIKNTKTKSENRAEIHWLQLSIQTNL